MVNIETRVDQIPRKVPRSLPAVWALVLDNQHVSLLEIQLLGSQGRVWVQHNVLLGAVLGLDGLLRHGFWVGTRVVGERGEVRAANKQVAVTRRV